MIKLFALLCFWLIVPQPNQHVPKCQCISDGPFLRVAPRTALVALVKVNRYLSFKKINDEKTPLSMEAEIFDVYKGIEKRKLITVWGNNGFLCRPYLSTFKEGEYYVIAFDSTGIRSGDEKTREYWISICGTYWLNVDTLDKIARGKIDERSNSLMLHEVRQQLAENDQRLRSTDNDH